MLEMQGVPIKSETAPSNHVKKRYPHLKEATDVKGPPGRKASAPKVIPSDIFSQLQTKTWVSPSPKATTEASPPDIFPEDKPASTEAEKFLTPEEKNAVPDYEDTESPEVIKQEKTGVPDGESPVESAGEFLAPTETSIDSLTEEPGQKADLLSFMEAQTTLQEEAGLTGSSRDDAVQIDDDDIEQKIAAFEEKLGMTCPLCRTSGIRSNETAKGKRYYHCTNSNCNFISWGKPYYITCPQCSNPFLVEAQDSSGRTMLKCPRATCHHWQKPPWELPDEISEISESPQQSSVPPVSERKPRRKVKRRRRVVRRKR